MIESSTKKMYHTAAHAPLRDMGSHHRRFVFGKIKTKSSLHGSCPRLVQITSCLVDRLMGGKIIPLHTPSKHRVAPQEVSS